MFETTAMTAIALFRALPEPSAEAMRDRLNAGVGAFGLSFSVDSMSGDEVMAVSNGAMRVSVAIRQATYAAERMAGALTGSYTRIRPNDYAARIAAHCAYADVTVADVRSDRTLAIPETTLIVVCHAALVALVAQAQPLVIHWQQSDMLVLPNEIPQIRGIGFPVSLATRPEIQQVRPDPRGRVRFGVTAVKSELFFDKPVRIEPTTYPMPEVLSLLDFCILRRLGGEDLLTDGANLGLPGPVEVTVRHIDPTPEQPKGVISLTLRQPMPRPQPARPFPAAEAIASRMAAAVDQPRLKARGGSETPKAQRPGRG